MLLLRNLHKTLLWSMVIVAFLSVGLVVALSIVQEYRRFEVESRDLKEEYLAGQKALVKQEVDRVVDYIEFQRSTTEHSLKKELQAQVERGHAIAENIYNRYQQSKSEEEIKGLIREALRPVRFYDNRGYYFIYDMQGNNILLPFSPQLEGKNLWDLQDSQGEYTIRRMVEMVREQGEGFLDWYWYKPGETKEMAKKIGYSKVFAPYNWWIGTGEYVEDVEQEIQQQTLARINTIRYGKDGYIFVYDFEATTLAHYKPENIGINQWNFRDPNGIPVLQELIRRSQQEDGVFLEYVATIRPKTGVPAAKMTYARAIKEWRWMVGTGVYIDEINEILAQKRAALESKIARSLGWNMGTLLLCLLLIVALSRYISGKIAANLQGFTAFFERAATGSSMVDEHSIHFAEFKGLAQAANQMIDERNKAAAAIDHLKEQLNNSRKMEALGMLAGGVAHDLNNVLSAIVGYPDLILTGLPADSPQRRYIEIMRDSGLKASEIVQDLLTLARRGVMQPVVLNLNALIERYLASPEHLKLRTHNPDIRFETTLSPDLLRIKGSPVHLQKTLMNLVLNAVEAQPSGGVIRLATENRYIDQPLPGGEQIEEGDYVTLTVGDEGIGIAESDRAHIFEPFFSKKKLGRSGTGLGMTVVWGTVQDHGGHISVSSEEGKGTLFALYFPVTREQTVEEGPADDPAEYHGNGETLLLVDDVREQRELAKAMLDLLGYRVETAAGGKEALAYLAEHPVDLLLLDMIMAPGIDGLETYERALALSPGQRAIIVSGYAETDRVQKAMELGARRYVKKPYTIGSLAKAVREALQSP
jgi:signal transduction histidine kinase/nitrogen-specific signal transduction histidine kinase/CheY-like chemotaxis protein